MRQDWSSLCGGPVEDLHLSIHIFNKGGVFLCGPRACVRIERFIDSFDCWNMCVPANNAVHLIFLCHFDRGLFEVIKEYRGDFIVFFKGSRKGEMRWFVCAPFQTS